MPGPKSRAVAAKKLSDLEADMMTLYGYGPGSHGHKPGENMQDFVARVKRQAPAVLIATEGSIEATSSVFGIDFIVLETMILDDDEMHNAKEEGERIRVAKNDLTRDAVLVVKEMAIERLKEERHRVTHDDDWPLDDPELFHEELAAILPQALEDYNGSVIQMAAPLNVTEDEIEAVIASSKALQRKQRICMTKDEACAEANFAEKAATGPAAGAFKFLSNRQPEKYSDKQQIDVKNVGFDVPPPDFGANALLKKKEDEE